MNEIKKYLDQIKIICPELMKDELNQFSLGLTITKLKKGDFYIAAGQTQKQGGFLINGLIRVFHTDNQGNEKNIYFVPENEYAFHYFSYMDNEPCPLSFQCLEPSTIICFPLNHLHNSYKKIPNFEKYGRIIVEVKLKTMQQRLESFLYQTAEQRYTDFINQYPNLFNRVSISQLCSYLGVERQTLTRIRKKLAKQK